jgi:FtsP/CotA-like multicopper oxidase with cupredoxin domain
MAASRRDFFRLGVGVAAGWVAARRGSASSAPPARGGGASVPSSAPATERSPVSPGLLPVTTPDLPRLPWTMDDGVKVFHLACDVVKSRFVPWREFNTWGYNGSTPGPTVEAVEGDRVRFVVENRLPEATTLHWHGLAVPHAMDGAEGISQGLIPAGGKFVYEFTLRQHGTFFYHSHRPMQQMMGMVGLFLIHPRQPYEPPVDRDFAWILQGWAALPGNPTPNSMSMEFNWLTMNGKSAPATTPALCRLGERVRLRFVNLGMDHHPMHLHGHTWVVTGTEGGRIPAAAWTPGNTELVGVAQARTVELVADNPGDWMIHCHLPHHMMNAMSSRVGPLAAPGAGLPAAGRMEEGMGIQSRGHALDPEMGPSLGRTTGVNAAELVPHAAGPASDPAPPAGGPASDATTGHAAHHRGGERAAPDARSAPGYPQDMFMVMDDRIAKPETHGLRPGWTGGMMGMMTLLRVLRPDQYDEIMALKARQDAAALLPAAERGQAPGGRK